MRRSPVTVQVRRRPTLTAVVALTAVLGVLVAWLYVEMEAADTRVNSTPAMQSGSGVQSGDR